METGIKEDQMKAVIYKEYGSPDVLEVKDVAIPIPKEDEVLVKIHAASVNAADWHLLRADPFPIRFMTGLFKPKYNILGCDIAGVVESAGKNVRQFRKGDAVFGDLSVFGWGGFAEYVCVRENALVLKPENISFHDAASLPVAAVTALQGLRDKGKIQSGQKVLINGASGGVGTFAVQIAKYFGAEVTAVCSTAKAELVRSIGADHVIDYAKEDFTKNGKQYDIILAANGFHPISDYKRALHSQGVYVMTGGSTAQMFQAILLGPWLSMFGGRTMGNLMVKPNQNDLNFMIQLLETGKVVPVIDKRYPLHEVADAIRYLEEGHAKGKVIITME
jgi:NADPH:quinone reductase-like Zn-dependent oxidoreductase